MVSHILAPINKLNRLEINLISHPPYSPDLAFSDFYLFRNLQNHLNNKSFDKLEEVKNEVNLYLSSKNSDFYKNGIYKVLYRWNNVIASGGNYLDD